MIRGYHHLWRYPYKSGQFYLNLTKKFKSTQVFSVLHFWFFFWGSPICGREVAQIEFATKRHQVSQIANGFWQGGQPVVVQPQSPDTGTWILQWLPPKKSKTLEAKFASSFFVPDFQNSWKPARNLPKILLRTWNLFKVFSWNVFRDPAFVHVATQTIIRIFYEL